MVRSRSSLVRFVTNPVAVALALAVLAVAVHWNGLGGELSFDDQAAVVSNEDVKQASVLHAGLLYNDFWGKAMDNSFSHKSFRPLVVASFGVNHALHGLEPFGYKVVNVGLHALVTVLLLALFLLGKVELHMALLALHQ